MKKSLRQGTKSQRDNFEAVRREEIDDSHNDEVHPRKSPDSSIERSASGMVRELRRTERKEEKRQQSFDATKTELQSGKESMTHVGRASSRSIPSPDCVAHRLSWKEKKEKSSRSQLVAFSRRLVKTPVVACKVWL